VLGLPFPDRTGRLAWCVFWSDILVTWNVAKGFGADTGMRRPRVQCDKLYLSSDSAPTSKAELLQGASGLSAEANGQGPLVLGYKVLSATALGHREEFNELLPAFESLGTRAFWDGFCRPHFEPAGSPPGIKLSLSCARHLTTSAPDTLLNYVLIDLRTSETSQLLLRRRSGRPTSSTPIGDLAQHLERECSELCAEKQILEDVVVYASLLYPRGESRDTNLQGVMTEVAECWRKMLVDGATLFLAYSPELVVKLFEQKDALDGELTRFGIFSNNIEEGFEPSRDEFLGSF